jgi:hypothetical protein
MPQAYCPNGHRVSYDAAKPKTCPTCRTEMEPKVAAIASAVQAPAPVKQPWPDVAARRAAASAPAQQQRAPVEYESFEDSDLSFDRASIRLEGDAPEVMTVGELAESKTPIERTEQRGAGRAEGGVERVSTADLVKQMIATGAEPEAATKSARPRRAKSGGGGKRASSGKGAGA